MVSNFEFYGHPLQIGIAPLFILGYLQILSNSDHLLLHFVEHIRFDNELVDQTVPMY